MYESIAKLIFAIVKLKKPSPYVVLAAAPAILSAVVPGLPPVAKLQTSVEAAPAQIGFEGWDCCMCCGRDHGVKIP